MKESIHNNRNETSNINKNNNEKFKVIECSTEKIVVNREPQNQAEETLMRLSVVDEIAREIIDKNLNGIEYRQNKTINNRMKKKRK